MSKPFREGFFFFLASDQDSKYLYAEVYCGDYRGEFSVCVINTEKGRFEITFHNDPRINPGYDLINANLDEFIITLERAKEELLKFYNGTNDPR